MKVGEICTRSVVYAEQSESLLEVARKMREQLVGCVVVVEKIGTKLRPEGVITDRDLVLEVLAAKIDPGSVTAADILISELVCVAEDKELWEALNHMRYFGVKRAPVVDPDGFLKGIFSIDDSLPILSNEFCEIVKLLSNQQSNERHARMN